MVDLAFWITSVESEYVHTQYVVQAPAVLPGLLSCNGVWNGAEVSQPAPPCSSIAVVEKKGVLAQNRSNAPQM